MTKEYRDPHATDRDRVSDRSRHHTFCIQLRDLGLGFRTFRDRGVSLERRERKRERVVENG